MLKRWTWYAGMLFCRLFGSLSKKKNQGINLDDAARTFIEDQTDCGPKRVREFVEDMDIARMESIAKEVDPLENVVEIQPDSVTAIIAEIPPLGTPSQFLASPPAPSTIHSDRIREVIANIRTVKETVGKDGKTDNCHGGK